MNQEIDYDKIMSDRKLFNEFVYTPLSEAIKILEERQKDPELKKKIENLLNGNIPEVMKGKVKRGFQFRQLATPNNDCRWFLKLVKEYNLEPVLCENPDDKFISKNTFKHSLGKIIIFKGINKKDDTLVEKIKIIDMVYNDGKSFKDIKTLWGEPLVDFHKNLFIKFNLNKDLIFYNISDWFKANGKKASEYYKNLILLFICHGILFENFLPSGSDGQFTKEVVLPSIERAKKLTGLKPLITPIPPMDIEDDEYWVSHLPEIKKYIKNDK